MDKKQRKPDIEISLGIMPPCPLCGTPSAEQLGVGTLDDLLRSNVELASLLRLVGRRLARYKKEDSELERMRHALNRAHAVRRLLRLPERGPVETHSATTEAAAQVPLEFEYATNPGTSEDSMTKSMTKRRLVRPRALRVV